MGACGSFEAHQTGAAAATPPSAPAIDASRAQAPPRTGPSGAGLPDAPSSSAPLPRIDAVTPSRGSADGGDLVHIEGAGFDPQTVVLFGGLEGRMPYVEAGSRILVMTPAHAPGVVDVVVRRGDGAQAELPGGFEFVTPLELHGVDPASGPAAGGTPVVVRGRGFDDETVVLFGGVPCIAPQLHGEGEIACITPGGPPGPVDIQVASAAGFVTRLDAFRYRAAPRIERVWPPAGPASGGTSASIEGEALWPDATVQVGTAEAQVIAPGDGEHVGIVTPPGPVGPADLQVTTHDGTTVVGGAFTYLSGDESFALWNVVPAHGPLDGGNEVVLVVTGLDDEASYSVAFGQHPAQGVAVDASAHALTVVAPPGAAPGPVDVTVEGPDGIAVLEAAYRYAPRLAVDAVVPAWGPVDGNTDVVVHGKGFLTSSPVSVRFGPLPATLLEVVDDETLRVRTPPGPAGLVDVGVTVGPVRAVAPKAFEYRPQGGVSLFALHPTRGAIAGGTYVELYGQGFEPDTLVWFGKAQAKEVTVVSPTTVAVRTPPYPVATVDVTLVSAGQARTLHGAFTYFNPDNPKGGAWGPPIRGAVNVTVWDNGADTPLQGATVVLGAGPNAWVRTTDANGQTVFSAKGLRGPVQVSASKAGYTAYTVTHFDAENLSVGLWPSSPPSPGAGGGQDAGAVPIVGGHVLGFGKYVQAPPRACEELAGMPPGYCEPCAVDADCAEALGNGARCVPVPQLGGSAPRRCTMPCATDQDCPASSVCAAWGGLGALCLPAPLPKAGFCVTTQASPFDDAPEWTLANLIGDDGTYAIPTDTGELAIVCYGGVVLSEGVFVPVVMGVRRHVFVSPGDVLDGQDVTLDIPMDRTLDARIVHPPGHGDIETIEYHISLELDGDDGFIVFRLEPEALPDGTLRWWPLPHSLTGPLAGARYAFFTRITGTGSPGAAVPTSVNLIMGVEDIDPVSVWAPGPDGAWAPLDGAPTAPLEDVWGDGAGFFVAVGPRGALFHAVEGQWWQQPHVVDVDLHAVWGTGPGDVWAVGDAGTALHFDGVKWSIVDTGLGFDLHDVWGSAAGGVFAVGDGGIARWDGAGWTLLPIAHAEGLRALAGHPAGLLVAAAADGRVVLRDGASWSAQFVASGRLLTGVWVGADGAVAVAGPGGVVRMRTAPGAPWQVLDLDDGADVRALWGAASDDLWVAGAGGMLRHWDGAAWEDRALGDPGFDVAAMWGLGPAPALAVGRARFPIGPFEDFPAWVAPAPQGALALEGLSWTPPTPQPDYHTLAVVDAAGTPVWKVLVDGAVDTLSLPDFSLLAGFSPLPPFEQRLVLTHVLHAPETPFSIDAFDVYDFNIYRRLSWSSLYVLFSSP